MNPFSNVWNHPKTSAAGLLIAVVTIAGVLSQQGLTLGAAGSGTIVTLVSAIATALLGLLARDPSSQTVTLSESATSRRVEKPAFQLQPQRLASGRSSLCYCPCRWWAAVQARRLRKTSSTGRLHWRAL